MSPYFVMTMGLLGLCLSVWFSKELASSSDEWFVIVLLGAFWAGACLFYVFK